MFVVCIYMYIYMCVYVVDVCIVPPCICTYMYMVIWYMCVFMHGFMCMYMCMYMYVHLYNITFLSMLCMWYFIVVHNFCIYLIMYT